MTLPPDAFVNIDVRRLLPMLQEFGATAPDSVLAALRSVIAEYASQTGRSWTSSAPNAWLSFCEGKPTVADVDYLEILDSRYESP